MNSIHGCSALGNMNNNTIDMMGHSTYMYVDIVTLLFIKVQSQECMTLHIDRGIPTHMTIIKYGLFHYSRCGSILKISQQDLSVEAPLTSILPVLLILYQESLLIEIV